jgi:small subunit ribosomal protein S16
MSVRMRLSRKGRRKQPFYHVVIADKRRSRDGKYIEKIGTYNPMTKPTTIDLDRDLAFEWIQKGAQPSDTVRAILRFKGVLYRAHLAKGVKKGALTEEKAEQLYMDFISEKDEKVEERRKKTADEQEALRVRLFGEAPKPQVDEEE